MSTAEPAGAIAPPPVDRSAQLRRRVAAVVGSIVVAGGFAWLMHAGALPVVPSRESFAAMAWWTVPAYCAIWLAVLLLRGMRWYWLLQPIHPVSMRRVLTASFVGYGALILLPFRMGELVRGAMIHEKGKVSIWAATGSAGAERVLDGLYLSIVLFTALRLAHPLSPLPDHIGALPIPTALVQTATYSALAVFALAFVAIGVFYRWRVWARRTTERVVGLVSPRLATWLADKVEHVTQGLGFLPETRYTGPFLAITTLYWLVNAAGIWLLCLGCGIHAMTLAEAAAVMGVLALGILVPNAPGFFGSFQLSVYAGLAMYHPASIVMTAGSAVVFTMYAVQIGVSLLAALFALIVSRRDHAGAQVS
jgi:hypothetical protein